MEIYFDNSATTRCYDSVKDIVVKTMTEDFGNPSAMHLKGVDAEKYVKESAKTIAGILKVQEKEILFTSGGTESDNLALIGGAMANKRNGNHIIITSVEHAAVSQPALYLQEQGFEITYLPVDELLDRLHDLEKAADRKRIIHWGPRTLDLDILFYDNEIIDTEDLHIPHIDMENRDFVLKPMVEIAPYYRHPILNQTMEQLLNKLEV